MNIFVSIVLVLVGAMFCMFCGASVESYERSRSQRYARHATTWAALGLLLLVCSVLVR